jgi:uncharacterized cupin superfamily protein
MRRFYALFGLQRFNGRGSSLVAAVSEPVVFAAAADIELSADPIRLQWITEGTPQVRSKRLAQSADGTSMIMAWSCTAGRFE